MWRPRGVHVLGLQTRTVPVYIIAVFSRTEHQLSLDVPSKSEIHLSNATPHTRNASNGRAVCALDNPAGNRLERSAVAVPAARCTVHGAGRRRYCGSITCRTLRLPTVISRRTWAARAVTACTY